MPDEMSLVMNTYRPEGSGRQESVERTIKSVRDQKKVDVQFIIVDDGSPEPLSETLIGNADYTYIEHSGRNVARNTGLGKCTGIGFSTIGDDDYLPDDMCLYHRVKRFTSKDDACAIWTRGMNVYPSGRVNICCPNKNQTERYDVPIPFRDLEEYRHHAGTMLIATKYIREAGLKIRWCAEADLFYRMAKLGKLYGEKLYSFPEITYRYYTPSQERYHIPLRNALLELVGLYYPLYNLPDFLTDIWSDNKTLQEKFEYPHDALDDYTFMDWVLSEGRDEYDEIRTWLAGKWQEEAVTHNINNIPHDIDWFFHDDSCLPEIEAAIEYMRGAENWNES